MCAENVLGLVLGVKLEQQCGQVSIFTEEEKQRFLDSWSLPDVDLSPFRTIFGDTPFFSAGGHNDTNVWGVLEKGTYDALLFGRYFISNPDLVELIAQRIRGVITAQKYVLCQYNVERSVLAAASKIAPGKRAPTVTSLEADGWVAVSVMVEKKHIAPIMDELTKVGATDILVLDIANTRS